MSESPANSPEDREAQELLDAYLSNLQEGRNPDRQKILADRPDLASFLDCLERLAVLAPQPNPSRNDSEATLPPRSPAAMSKEHETGLSGPLSEFGRRIGKYEIERELGRGGMGVVYLAKDSELGRPVALKMILSGSLADPEHQRRFHVEVRSAARLDHEGIVRIYDTGAFNGLTYLAMQYIDGCTLADVIRKDRPDRETAIRCVIHLARTVAYLHSQGIVHRDLKPGNVLLEMRNAERGTRNEKQHQTAQSNFAARYPQSAIRNPKITDFGLAKLLDDSSALTCSNAVIGTPSYMAPEQARGESAKVGPAADIYALGAILYEMLTGKPPFAGETALEILLQVMSNEPAPLRRFDPEIPRDLEFICLKCLEKSPSQRFQSANELADALERHLKGEEPASPSLTIWHIIRRWALRAPGLAARVGILALVSITLIVRAIIRDHYNFIPGPVAQRIPQWMVFFGQLPVLLLALAGWIGISAVFQRGLRTDWGNRNVPYLWGSLEVFILTTLLVGTGSLASPLDIGFPLFIIGSGLWLRERLVWFTAYLTAVGYSVGTLIYAAVGEGEQFHRHVIFIIGLFVTAYIVSFQVRRFRMLSRYYEGRSLD